MYISLGTVSLLPSSVSNKIVRNLAKCLILVKFLSKAINKKNYSKNGHSVTSKTNRFQSGFRDAFRFFQKDQTVNK